MSPWGWLALAATAEIAWSQSIAPTDSFTRPLPSLVCVALAICAVYPLTRAVQEIPVGTAYAVFTGVGATGAVVLGIVLSGDAAGPARILGLALVLAGVLVLRVVDA